MTCPSVVAAEFRPNVAGPGKMYHVDIVDGDRQLYNFCEFYIGLYFSRARVVIGPSRFKYAAGGT